MQDLISRQAAIDAVKKNTFRLTFAEEQNCEGHVAWSAEAVYSDVMEGALLELPSAQPEIIHCRWCKHWREGDAYSYCNKLFNAGVLDVYDYMAAEDDFCSKAERREE